MLTLGFSPCPNDTFIFSGLVHSRLGQHCAVFDKERLADVETLNNWALAGKLDVTKISFHALGHVLEEYALLRSGAALGRGCGPLLVAGKTFQVDELADLRIAIPGKYTTAAMLLRLFAPACTNLVEMAFDRIMPGIVAKEVDAGVIIHESRFTYPGYGLQLIQDLGAWWETISGHPIPLGGIAAKRSLGETRIRLIESCIQQSVRWAYVHKEECMPYIKKNAQELDDRVIGEHIGLYVNAFSVDLGESGMAAIEDFLERGRQAGLLPGSYMRLLVN